MRMGRQTLAMAADVESRFEHYRKPTRRDEFLKTMQAIESHYPNENKLGETLFAKVAQG